MPQVGAGRGLRGLRVQVAAAELQGAEWPGWKPHDARAAQHSTRGRTEACPLHPHGEGLGPKEGQCVPGERPCPVRLLRGSKLATGAQAPQSRRAGTRGSRQL